MAKGKIIQLKDNAETTDALFVKFSLETISSSDYVLVDEAHSAIIIKNGGLGQTLNVGKHQLTKFASSKDVVEVIFFPKTSKMKMLWGTKQQFDFRDPVEDVVLKVGANGELEVQVTSPRKFFLELGKGKNNFTSVDLKDRIQAKLIAYLEEFIGKVMNIKKMSYDQMEENKTVLAKEIKPLISNELEKDFGIKLASITINGVIIPNQYLNQLIQARESRLALNKENINKIITQEDELKLKQINQSVIINQNKQILQQEKEQKLQAEKASIMQKEQVIEVKEPQKQATQQNQHNTEEKSFEQQAEEEGLLLL